MWHRPCCAKTTESIELPFAMVSGLSQTNRALNEREYWCHLVNMVERLCLTAMSGSATRGGDVACSQITLGNLVTSLRRSIIAKLCSVDGLEHRH